MTFDPITSPADDESQDRLREESPPLPSPHPAAPATRRHPLQSFGLANFKAFGANEQTIPLRPITLIFGPNSGGKSSILHFLLWMKDVVEGKGPDLYFPTAGGTSVDLGGFKQLRHGNDPETEVSVRLHLNVKDAAGHVCHLQSVSTFAAASPPSDYTRIIKAMVAERFAEVLSRNSFETLLEKSPALESAVIEPVLQKILGDHGKFTLQRYITDLREGTRDFSWEQSGECMHSWSTLREENCPKLDELNRRWALLLFGDDETPVPEGSYDPNVIAEELQSLALAVFDALDLHSPSAKETQPSLIRFELIEAGHTVLMAARDEVNNLRISQLNVEWLIAFHRSRILERLRGIKKDDLWVASKGLIFQERATCIPGQLLYAQESGAAGTTVAGEGIRELIEGTPEIPGLLCLCQIAAKETCSGLSYLGPLRAYPQRNITVADLPQMNDPEGLFAWRLIYERADVRAAVNEWLTQPAVTPGYEIIVDHRVELNVAAKRISDDLDHTISRMKRNVADLFQLNENSNWRGDEPDALNEAYETLTGWDHLASIREALEATRTSMESQASGIVYLRDKRTGKQVTSRDIGVGMSQLIPVLALAKAAQGEFIAIEQPEIHIHPALQAELGDVFIQSALKQGNTFLIETHSEHLVLRILRRIRETARGKLPEGKQPIRPEDVCILYVEPTESGSIVREMPVNERGELVKGWPGGFFEERLDELL